MGYDHHMITSEMIFFQGSGPVQVRQTRFRESPQNSQRIAGDAEMYCRLESRRRKSPESYHVFRLI